MLTELGKYEPYGKSFLENKPHLGQESNVNPVIDFSAIDTFDTKTIPPPKTMHKLFSVKDNITIDVGDRLDERNLYDTGKLHNPALQLEQEVYVRGSTVVWSRAGCVIKTFDYSAEIQPIQQVLFAWFPVTSAFFKNDPTNKPAIDAVLNDFEGDKYLVEGYWDKKGPQSIINLKNAASAKDEDVEEETDPVKQLRPLNNIPEVEEKDGSLQRRTLCIVFQDCIKLHCEDGIHVTAHIPFEIDHVVPLDMGVLVSRKYVPDKWRKSAGRPRSSSITNLASLAAGMKKPPSSDDTSSFFVTVTHPLKGACPVKSKDVNHNGISTLPEPLTSPQRLLFATTKVSDTGRLPVIVTLNIKENRHYIWTYERRKEKNQQAIPAPANMLPPVKRKPHNNATPAIRKKLKSGAPPNISRNSKKQKTGSPSRSHAQFHEDYISDEEVLHENEVEKDIYNEMLDPSEISLRLLWREPAYKMPAKLKTTRKVNSEAFLIHDLNGQELICIVNHSMGHLQVINLGKATHLVSNCIEMKIPARSAVPINATRDGYSDLLFLDASNRLHLFVDASMKRIPLRMSGVTKLIDPVYDRFTAVTEKGMIRCQLNGRPETSLVRDCFAAIDCANTLYFPKILARFLSLQETPSDDDRICIGEWENFFVALLSFLRVQKQGYYYRDPNLKSISSRETQLQQIRASNNDFLTNELGFPSAAAAHNFDFLLDENYFKGVPTRWIDRVVHSISDDAIMDISVFIEIVNSLHMVYEDYRIKKSMLVHANMLGYLLMQCAIILKNQNYIDYYANQGIQPSFTGNLHFVDNPIVDEIFTEPPNIQVCLRQMTPYTTSNPTLLSSFGVNTLETSLGYCLNTYAKTIKELWSLYGAINHVSGDKSLLLERMILHRITRKDIGLLIESLATPILNVLDDLKMNPLVHWTKEAYNIIGRDDIYQQLQMKATVCDPNTDTFKLPFLKDSDHPQNMNTMMKDYSATPVVKCAYESDVLNMETERLRFGFGGFIEKVRIMLDATRIPDHLVVEQPDLSDEDLAAEHQSQVAMLVQRTLSLAAGRAIYAYGTHIPDLTKALPSEIINLSAKILPLRTVVAVDDSQWSKEFLHWPQFHNGVAAGLRISPNNQCNDSWIDFCVPQELDPQSGGILLALGLNGILKKLPLVHWYRFVTQQCDLVNVGFILGAAVAYRGTKDIKVTKVLSVYIPALLPPESASFNHSNSIQATGLLSMGLVYMNSCDRLMASIMLREIAKNAYTDPSTLDSDYEGCALAAGFSLGFMTLGLGENALPVVDHQLRNKLHSLMTGRIADEGTSSINLDVTSPGATVALALMYLKTENSRVAEGIELLETRPYLNYVRPDFLLMRIVAKNLIMWSTIQPTCGWIEEQIPDFLNEEMTGENSTVDVEVVRQAVINITCGACLCIGLRFAGSKNPEAFATLLHHLDALIKDLNLPRSTPQQRVTKCALRTGIDVLCTAAAMVMAGTGDRGLLQRLEQLHHRVTSDMTYGNHMAVSMSLGLLFMGLGGYTLTTSNEAIAGLLCAFYPFYPTATGDNRYHLQAFRHLWVLAVDSRWLMPFDIGNKKPCRVPMKLEIYNDDGEGKVRQVRIEAPSVVPDYKLIKSIRIDGDRYWPLSVNMLHDGKYQNSIIKSGVIYVKRKDNKKSYEEDPYGKRNLKWT
ncbi:Anaphase-promoting complex subunit 1 [Mucor circinelloides]